MLFESHTNEQVRIWQEAVVVQFKVLSKWFHFGSRERLQETSGSLVNSQDFNCIPLKYKLSRVREKIAVLNIDLLTVWNAIVP